MKTTIKTIIIIYNKNSDNDKNNTTAIKTILIIKTSITTVIKAPIITITKM